MLDAGTYLSRRYEIVRKIGTGGMADVYRGKDHKLRRYVAIKVLKPEFAADESFVRKFQIEAQAAAGMLHPNVVNVYDVGEDNGYNYMVMELVDGITLKEYIQKKGKLSDKETISIAIQMAAGLDAAHQKKLVHRDVKPQNVMISNEGKVKVTDFGIAKPATSNTITANVMGSVHYTSPEQARGGACDIQSDIYSTGITIYEMITGSVPFDGESTVSIAVKHLQEEILPPSEYTPNMYYSLEQIILKCTQKNPSRRYLSMDDLMLDLKHSLMDPDGDFVDLKGLVYQNPVKRGYYNEDDDYDEVDEDEEDDDVAYVNTYNGKGEAVDPRMQQITKILTIVVAVIAVFTVIFISVKAISFFGNSSGEVEVEEGEIEVPSIVGLTEEEAKALLEEYGLDYYVDSREESLIYEEGYIISQTIEEGEMVIEGTTVHVTVSSGLTEETVNVPEIVGESEDDAQQMLSDVGLKINPTYEYSDDVEQGYIISADPEEGTEVAAESTVNVVVSKGEEPPETVSVPNIVGEKQTYAESALASYDLKSSVTEEYSDDVASGVVISQSIEAGEEVEIGTTVEYVVSKGQAPVEMPYVLEMSETQAVTAIENSGLVANVSYAYSSTVTAGKVISSNKSYGTSLTAGTTVNIVVSLGPEVTTDTGTDSGTDSETEAETDTTQ